MDYIKTDCYRKNECDKIYCINLLVFWRVEYPVYPMDASGYDNLPILLESFRYVLIQGKADAFENLRALMDCPDVDSDVGREGELIFHLVYETAGCYKLFLNFWISSVEDSTIRVEFSDLHLDADYEALYQSHTFSSDGGNQCHPAFLRSLSPYLEGGARADTYSGTAGGA